MRPCRRRRLCTRHSSNTTARTHSDMAPFFSTSNRPWDVKEPLRAYPQYRPASSSLGSGRRWSRTLLRVIYSLTLPVPCDPAGSSPFRSGEARREPLLVWPRGMRFSKCTYPLPIPLHSASSEPAQGPTTSIPRCLASRSALVFSLLLPRVRSLPPCPQIQSTKKSSSTPPFTVAGRAAPHLAYAERGGGRAHLTATGENKPGKLGAVAGMLCVHVPLQPSDRACRGSSLDHAARLCRHPIPQPCVQCW